MELIFPHLGGGPQQGLNDAGVETFLGAVDSHLVRECGQNSGDASAVSTGDRTRVEFDKLTIPIEELPGSAALAETIRACIDRWGNDPKSKAFFEDARAVLAGGRVTMLRISDYGTTGLTGSDTDEQGRWFALVKSQGVSNKDAVAAGSFGIGKSSPFAASRLRTVFYSTKTDAGSVAFQGVSRLVTHKGPDGKLTQGTGFIGYRSEDDSGPVFRAVRDAGNIPDLYLRTTVGTDIWVVGYSSGDEWAHSLLRSILQDFWPAVHFGRIEFRVGDQVVGRDNLATHMERHANQDSFTAHQYFRAVESTPIRRRLRTVGECELYLVASTADLPRQVCMARRSGMRIYDYAPRACRVPFAGLFHCMDSSGNALLRKLEPPRHDGWDPRRVEGREGARALEEIKAWIREEVKKLNPHFAGSSFNESELAKYLPDITQNEVSPIPSVGRGAIDEQLTPRPKPLTKPTAAFTAVPHSPGADADAGGAGTDGKGGVPPHSRGSSSAGRTGSTGGQGKHEPPRVESRAFPVSPGRYRLILRSAEDFAGDVVVRTVGEDGGTEAADLSEAASADGGAAFNVEGGTVRNITLRKDTPLRLVVSLRGAGRRALTAELTR